MKHLFTKEEHYTKEGVELNKKLHNYFKAIMNKYKDYPTLEIERIVQDSINTIGVFERAFRSIDKKIKPSQKSKSKK